MQRSRLLILVGLVLLLLTGGAFFALTMLGSLTAAPTPIPFTPTPENAAQIVIAVQPLTRGVKIPPEALAIAPWPANNLPPSAITDTKQIVGKVPRFNLDRGLPILQSMIVDPNKLEAAGSEIAYKIDPGKTAISLPINRLSSVAYGLTDGDHVNVLVAMLFADLNEATQTKLPLKLRTIFQDPTSKAIQQLADVGVDSAKTADYLRFDSSISLLQPAEAQRPRLVVQQIAQDVVVLKVGTFTKQTGAPSQAAPAAAAPTPEPAAQPTAAPPPPSGGTPTPGPAATPSPDIITLSVTQQDALVLNYFMYAGAKFTLTLRAAGDTSRVDTESVTLQYTMQRFRISVPAQLAYGLEPAIRSLKTPTLPNDPAPALIPLPDGTFLCSGANCP